MGKRSTRSLSRYAPTVLQGVPRESERRAADRRELLRMLKDITPGDVVTVTRIDRVARSTRDLLNTLAAVTGKGAGFRSLNDTWADTTTAHGRLMLTVLGGLAEFERSMIRHRCDEGRIRAKAQSRWVDR
jgi:DNA invertase Pin-like site-specific DNA recombinase